MGMMHQNSWDKAVNDLKTAALHPQGRGEMIVRALQELLLCFPAAGTALVWPCQDRDAPWKVYYVGTNQQIMQHWLEDRLDFSFGATLGVIQHDLGSLTDMPIPHLISLQPATSFHSGLWIVWTPLSTLSGPIKHCVEEVRQTLEALIEVEIAEKYYFSSNSPLSDRAMIEALGQGDPSALSTFLRLTCWVGNANLTFWGRAYPDVVETKDHWGADKSDFGFVLERGKGVGGYIANNGTPILRIEDYRESSYRDPSVSRTVDSEQARSGLVLPVRSRTALEAGEQVAGVLYLARRTVKSFSLAESLLVQRLIRQLEPLRPLTRPFSLLSPGLPSVADPKSGWYPVVLRIDPRA